jgi:hypothetical protein
LNESASIRLEREEPVLAPNKTEDFDRKQAAG